MGDWRQDVEQERADGSNVVVFTPRKREEPAEPFFSDEERAEIRKMLAEFKAIKRACPTARRLLDTD